MTKGTYISFLKKGYYVGHKYSVADFNSYYPIEVAEKHPFLGCIILKENVLRDKLLNDAIRVERHSVFDTQYFCIINEQANGAGYIRK